MTKLIAAPSARNEILILLISSLLFIFAGCSKKQTVAATPAEAPQQTKIDYDLSGMNFTMISSFFFQMLIEPETYENKTFKIKGSFQTFENPDGELPYFSVIMNDATMCCQEGMDFVWEGDHKWPQDYPPEGTEISIIGKYIVTEEDGFSYNYLLASDVITNDSSTLKL